MARHAHPGRTLVF